MGSMLVRYDLYDKAYLMYFHLFFVLNCLIPPILLSLIFQLIGCFVLNTQRNHVAVYKST